MSDPLDSQHYKMVIKAITDGRVVPFLSAGVNLCGRLAGTGSPAEHTLSPCCSGMGPQAGRRSLDTRQRLR